MPRQPSEGREMYRGIAEELGSPTTTLDDLDPRSVTIAKEWAKKNKRKWPPRAEDSGLWNLIVASGMVRVK